MYTLNSSNSVTILQDMLKKFRDITIEMKNSIEKEDYDSIEMLLNGRQEIIDYLTKFDYSREEFVKICDEYNILQLQNEVKDAMISKKAQIRSKIEELSVSKNASKNYNKKFAADAIFFNKQI